MREEFREEFKKRSDTYYKIKKMTSYERSRKNHELALNRIIDKTANDPTNKKEVNLKDINREIKQINSYTEELNKIRRNISLKELCYKKIYEDVIDKDRFFNKRILPNELIEYIKDIYDKKDEIENYEDSDDNIPKICNLM